MIVPMKKASVVVLDRFRERALRDLRRLGLLHIETHQAGSEEVARLLEEKSRLERAAALLPEPARDRQEGRRPKSRKPRKGKPAAADAAHPAAPPGDAADTPEPKAAEVAEQIAACVDSIRSLREHLERLQREEERLAPWGDFDPEEARGLARQGVFLRLYELSERELRQLRPQGPETAGYRFVLSRGRERVRLAAVFMAEDQELRLPDGDGGQGAVLEAWPLPERGVGRVRQLAQEAREELEAQEVLLLGLSQRKQQLLHGLREVDAELEFARVSAGMTEAEELAYLSGYLPARKTQMLREAAARHGWALLLEDPAAEDPVPTLIENPRWISIIKPMFNLLGTVAGYREFDISFWFLLFFSLFFAILIGDAGYGLVLIALTLFARLKMRKAPAGPFALLFVLSGATVVWGALSGTWFGVEALARHPVLSRLVLPQIASFGFENTDTIMLICFAIGAVHLSVAHLVSFFRRLPRLGAFADLGWLSMLWGLFFVVRYIVLQQPLHPVAPYLIVPGLILVIVFAEQQGRFLKGLLVGVAKMPLKFLNSISAFSDIISYVRLFAVGLATIEVAKSFNAMASGIGFGIPAGLAAALVLFFGHTLNIIMAAMSVIVHGVRLNMLEFSGHLGMEWTGIPYEPFRERGTSSLSASERSTE